MIILLNGASSSGKTTLARALQAKWDGPLLHLGIDTTIGMLPAAYVGMGPRSCEGFEFYYDADDRGPVVRLRSGPVARKLGASIARAVALLAADGHDLVLDYVILETKDLVPYLQELGRFRVYFVGVRCDLGTLEARELSRGDRMLNLARPQHGAVHAAPRHYDLEVDTTAGNPYDLATRIIKHTRQNPQPDSFVKLRAELGVIATQADGVHNQPFS
jgi:chloramphenicol 3-O phosphotransferase